MKKELITAWREAWSLENRNSDGDLEEVGRFKAGTEGRGYIIYRDPEGLYWYKTVFQGETGLISETEHVFGKKKTSRRGNMSHAPRRP